MEPKEKIAKIEAKDKKDVAKVDAKEKKQFADDEAKKVTIDTKAQKKILRVQSKKWMRRPGWSRLGTYPLRL